MACFAATVVKVGRLISLGVLLSVTTTMSGLTGSAQSNIDVTVCDGVTPAMLTAALPANESVVSQPDVSISGSVSQANQLEVYMDDAFNGVQPLSARDTSYSTDVQLPQGTHTVTLVAVDTCQVANATASVVLTYEPAVTEPAPDGDTEVETEVPGGGVIIAPTPSSGEPETHEITGSSYPFRNVIEQFIKPPLVTIGESLDLTSSDVAVQSGRLSNMARFAMLVGGLSLVFLASYFSKSVVVVLRHMHMHIKSAAAKKIRHNSRSAFVSIGVLLVGLMFIL